MASALHVAVATRLVPHINDTIYTVMKRISVIRGKEFNWFLCWSDAWVISVPYQFYSVCTID